MENPPSSFPDRTPPEEEARRGRAAQQVLENEAFKRALETIEKDVISKFTDSSFSASAGALRLLRLRWGVIQDLRIQLNSLLETGEMATMQLQELERTAEGLEGVEF